MSCAMVKMTLASQLDACFVVRCHGKLTVYSKNTLLRATAISNL